MARTAIPVTDLPNWGATLDNPTETAADDVNDHEFPNSGRIILCMFNYGATPLSADVISTGDRFGRTGDVTMTAPAAVSGDSGKAFAGPFKPELFNQADGTVHVDLTDDTDIEFLALRIPTAR